MSNPILRFRRFGPALLLTLAAAPSALLQAATPVHADPALSCAGQTPCYATIQEAVDNAGPAPAEVLIFPGTYAESVTLATMGSAMAGSPGDVSLQAVDAAGLPATSGVLISPPAGVALDSGMMGPFPGDVALRGLSATSPDTSAIGLSIDGDLIAEDIVADAADSAGLIGQVLGNASLARIRATLNGGGGLLMLVDGALQATDLQATRNGASGIAMFAGTQLVVDGASSEFNETGVQLYACDSADVRNVEARANQTNGITIFFGPNDCTPSTAAYGIGASRVAGTPWLPESFQPTARGTAAGVLVTENLLSFANGIAGIGIASTTGSATLDGLFAYDNAGPGMLVQVPTVEIDDAETLRSAIGVIVIADQADLTRVIASQSLAMPANPPAQGSGLVISATNAVIDDLQADDNPIAGLLLAEPQGGGRARYEMVDSQFDGNGRGIQTEAAEPVDLTIGNTTVTKSTETGLLLPDLGSGRFEQLTVSGSPVGLASTIFEQLAVETSSITGNDTGAQVVVEVGAVARITCSDLTGNTTAGLALAQGDSLNARANYWGDASGPTHPANPGGTGDPVLDGASGAAGTVDYASFLAQSATIDDCALGLPAPVSVPTLDPIARALLLTTLLLIGLFALSAVRPAGR